MKIKYLHKEQCTFIHNQWWIQNFPEMGGGVNPPGGVNTQFLPNSPKNCMKWKEFGCTGVIDRMGLEPFCQSTHQDFHNQAAMVLDRIGLEPAC